MCFFFFQAEDGIRDSSVTGVQTCALPISRPPRNLWRLSECKAGRPGYHPQRYLLDRYRPEQSKTSLPKTSLPEVTAEMIKLRIIVVAIVLLAMGVTLVSLNGGRGGNGGGSTART